jgi:hypothetical protein
MAARIMKSDHTRIGWTATTERSNAKWRLVQTLSSYPAIGLHGQAMIGVTADGPEATSVLYLTHAAAVELAKGLLMNLMQSRGGPITMTADDELAGLLKQCEAIIAGQHEEAKKVVEAATGKRMSKDNELIDDPT